MISTKGRYALRVLVDVASQGEDACVPLHDVARRQEISEKYLQRIARLLVAGGLLVGASGRGGGYRLKRPSSETSVLAVLEATEGTLAPVVCLAPGAEPCERASQCVTLPLWRRYHALTREFFAGVTIADLMRGDIDDVTRASVPVDVDGESTSLPLVPPVC